MVGMKLNIKVLGLKNVLAAIEKAKEESKKVGPLYDKAIIILEQSTAKTFRMQGRPRWEPSQRAKRVHGKTLQMTNRLFQTVTARTGESIREISGNQLRFGTKIVYGPSHQFGDPEKNIPKRPFLGIYDEDRRRLEEVLWKDLDKRIGVGVKA